MFTVCELKRKKYAICKKMKGQKKDIISNHDL